MRQSYRASRTLAMVMVIRFAARMGMMWLMVCSIVVQSAIMLVVSSDKSLWLKKLNGRRRMCSASSRRIFSDSRYEAV